MAYQPPTIEEIQEATGQDFQQLARDLRPDGDATDEE